jgi:hypothetical protein
MIIKMKMKRLFLTIATFIITNILFGQTVIDSVYKGLQEMCWVDTINGIKDCYIDEARPKWKWYHTTILKFSGDSVFVEQSPILVHKKDTLYSASDGGFYYYSGTVTRNNENTVTLDLTETNCDYCGVLTKKQEDGTLLVVKRTKHFIATVTTNGMIINGQKFIRTNK